MSDDRFWELMTEAGTLPHGAAKVALLEEAVREADHLGNEEHRYHARNELVEATTFSGYREKAMVAYSWCLSYFDQHGDEFDYFDGLDLLWKYKWVVGQATDFPQISRIQIAEMLDDMERRFLAAGFNRRPIHYFRYQTALDMGDLDEARQHHENWKKVPRDMMADCEACECSSGADLYFVLRQDEKGIQSVRPILQGRLSCAEIPHNTLSKVLAPYIRRNRVAEALPLQQRGYRLISRNRDFLPAIARHMLFLTHVEDFNKATRMFSRHFAWAWETAVPEYRFRFYLASAVLFESLVKKKGSRKRKLKLPEKFPLKSDDDAYKPDELAAWLRKETELLTAKFNARNGNEYYTQHIQDARELAGLDVK